MLPPTNKTSPKMGGDADEIASLDPAPRPVITPYRSTSSMRHAVDLCAEALIQAMVSARKF